MSWIKGLYGDVFDACSHSQGALNVSDRTIPQPRALQLSVEKLSRDAAFLMDCGTVSSHTLTDFISC